MLPADSPSVAAAFDLQTLARRCTAEEGLIADLWQNVLELKASKQALAVERDLVRTLVDNMPDFIYVKDRSHRFTLNNRAHLRLLGVTEQRQALGKTDFDFFPREHAVCYFADEEIVLKYGTPIIDKEEENVDPSGAQTWVSTTKVALRNDDGKIIGVVGISRDTTHRKRAEQERLRLEEELAQAHKLEIFGQLAGGVVHDFNNMLCAINGCAKILIRRLTPTDPALARTASTILQAGESATALTHKLLAFVKREKLKTERLDLHQVIEGVTSLLGCTLDARIAMTRELRAGSSLVLADASLLENALLNIAVNARDAMAHGGLMTFATENVEVPTPGGDACVAGLSAGAYVVLSVSDTGMGMDEQTRARIFEPFFTTKEKGRGTGLGLSSVLVTVRNHGGAIAVDSMPGKGTTVRVYLPVTESVAQGAVVC